MPLAPPLILTLKLNQLAFGSLNELRQRYFPPERNFLPAHITLFHQLPGDQETAIQQTLQTLCAQTPVLSLSLPNLRFLGRGVAIEVDCPELLQLQMQLATVWQMWLSPQDQQGYRPHVTIQNKVTPEQARRLYNRLAETWNPIMTSGEGLLLWHYLGGPWELAAEFLFLG